MTRRRLLPLLLLGSLALLAAGCGGSKKKSYSASKADFAAALSSVCVAANAKDRALTITSAADLATKGDQLIAVADHAISQMKKLGDAPDEIKARFADALAKNEQALSLLQKAVAAAKAKDSKTTVATARQIATLGGSIDPDYKAIGATACLSTSG